jgi:3-oxoisoapionate decarboxylase
MRRRTFVSAAAAGLVGLHAAGPPRATLGIATTSFAVRPTRNTIEFLEYCHSLGAGGIQAGLNPLDAESVKKVRARAEGLEMFIETMAGLPRAGIEQFEAAVKGAKEAGASCVRVACLSGRRYETFADMESWKKFVAESKAGIERAIPILERHKMRMAIENHKDWTVEEFLGLLKQYSSPYVGVCLDLGNNISLLEDPMEVVEALAPYAFSTHIKDMGVQEYEEGFLLSEVPYGEGFLDLRRAVALVRKHHPEARHNMEMMTRDPLKVPCLTGKYWVTFPEREGRKLARTLAMVRKSASKRPLPAVTGRDVAWRGRYEEDNVKVCLNYWRERLEG